MRSSFFRQSRKEDSTLHPAVFSESSKIDGKKQPSLIWKGLEDGNASSTCDLDDDDYFESDHFISSNEISLSAPSKIHWNDNKWNKMLKFGDDTKKIDPVQFTAESPKILTLRNTAQKSHANKSLTSLDSFDHVGPQSPPNDMSIPKKAPASPMLNFLSKKPNGSYMQSPDTHNVSTSSEDTIYFHQTPKICSDYTGEVNLKKKVLELEKEIEIYQMSQNSLTDALKKYQVINEKLQVNNDSLHAQLNRENQNYIKANENYLKSEALVKHLEEITCANQNEIKYLEERAKAIAKELEEEKLNYSKVKEMLEVCEKSFHELKLNDEKNQKALDLAHVQIKEKEEHQEELKRQLITLNQEKEKNILKQIQLTNNINDVTIQLEYSRQEIGQQKLREKFIQEQNQRLENEKSELLKQNESIMDELLSLKERLDVQSNEIKQKQDDIDSLREIIEIKNIENSKSNKKVDKKLNESLNLIEKLREQIKELNQEKKEILKKHTMKEQELKKLEVKVTNQERELKEVNDEKKELYEELKRMKQDQIERETTLAENNRELLKLRSIEKEYQEFQHQIYANSPPVSTQLPKEIHEKVTQTPKSPALSLKLDSLKMIETPTKTPKSILKQPGSATKRRRVFFVYPDYESITNSQNEPSYQNQVFESPLFKKVSPYTMNTPKIQNLQTLEKMTNIRKTPRKSGRKITEECQKVDTEKSWFDCEQIFGYGAED
ncbi:unnamed protein product [Schistosoma turkestanicum]|nr:unnamed protein product [Schistosoma turkestanicum]